MNLLVLGMHRSGTSAVTRLIGLLGLYVGEEAALIGANDENPKGFWERQDVIALNSAILAHYGCDWYDLANWPLTELDRHHLPMIEAVEPQWQAVLSALDVHCDWAIKDPRLCLTLPFWQARLKSPVALIMHRHPVEVARSLYRRNGFPVAFGLALWELSMRSIIRHTEHMPHMSCDYADLLADPVGVTHQIATFLSAQGAQCQIPARDTILDFVEPSLRREVVSDADMALLNSEQQALFESLAAGAPQKGELSAQARILLPLAAELYGLHISSQSFEEQVKRHLQTIAAHERNAEELVEQVQRMMAEIVLKQSDIDRLHQQLSEVHEQLGQADAELATIKSTRTWKLRARLVGTDEA